MDPDRFESGPDGAAWNGSPTPVRLLSVRIESADGKAVYADAHRALGDTRKTLARKLSLSLRKGSPVTLEATGGRVRVSVARGFR